MKTLIATLIAASLPALAGAVTVDNCPKNLDVRLSDISVMSAERLASQLSKFENEEGLQEKFRQSLEAMDQIKFKAKLTKAEKARCEYTITQSSTGTDKGNQLILATSKGNDWLRFRLHIPTGIIGGFISVTSYDPTHGVETSGKATMGNDDPGHPGILTVMAWASSVEAK